jgi:hypothetical protein
LLASGAVAYLGAFNVVFRNEIVADWRSACEQVKPGINVMILKMCFFAEKIK